MSKLYDYLKKHHSNALSNNDSMAATVFEIIKAQDIEITTLRTKLREAKKYTSPNSDTCVQIPKKERKP